MSLPNNLYYLPYTPNTKSLTVAKYIFDEVSKFEKDPSIRKINILTYIAHGYMYALYGKRMLDEEIIAWMIGPAIPSLFQTSDHPPPNLSEVSVDFNLLTEEEKIAIYLVTSKYSETHTVDLVSGVRLPRTPWKISWEFNTNRRKNNVHVTINEKLIKHFYQERGHTSTRLYF